MTTINKTEWLLRGNYVLYYMYQIFELQSSKKTKPNEGKQLQREDENVQQNECSKP